MGCLMKAEKLAEQIAAFPRMPAKSGVTLELTGALLTRSRASLWRDIEAGRLKTFKIGRSRRVIVESIRAAMEAI